MDVNGFVVGCLVGPAGDPTVWYSEVTLAGTSALQAASELVDKTKKTWNPGVRGDFKFLNVGYSFGTGSVVRALCLVLLDILTPFSLTAPRKLGAEPPEGRGHALGKPGFEARGLSCES